MTWQDSDDQPGQRPEPPQAATAPTGDAGGGPPEALLDRLGELEQQKQALDSELSSLRSDLDQMKALVAQAKAEAAAAAAGAAPAPPPEAPAAVAPTPPPEAPAAVAPTPPPVEPKTAVAGADRTELDDESSDRLGPDAATGAAVAAAFSQVREPTSERRATPVAAASSYASAFGGTDVAEADAAVASGTVAASDDLSAVPVAVVGERALIEPEAGIEAEADGDGEPEPEPEPEPNDLPADPIDRLLYLEFSDYPVIDLDEDEDDEEEFVYEYDYEGHDEGPPGQVWAATAAVAVADDDVADVAVEPEAVEETGWGAPVAAQGDFSVAPAGWGAREDDEAASSSTDAGAPLTGDSLDDLIGETMDAGQANEEFSSAAADVLRGLPDVDEEEAEEATEPAAAPPVEAQVIPEDFFLGSRPSRRGRG